MNKLTKLLAITLAVAASVGVASAQTKIYVTGSTAFRGAAVTEITNLLAGTVSIAYDGNTSGVTSQSNANAVTWTGGNIGGTAVTIKASWSGSGAGIQTVAGAPAFNVNFLPDGAAGAGNSDPRGGVNAHEAAVPDIALSDIFQGATFFNGTFSGHTYVHLTDNTVGVVTFKWAASNGFPAGKSMTPQLAQNLFTGVGVAPLSMWTGVAADSSKGVYATGRNPDSGTRGTAFAESGIGVFSVVQQYKPTVSGTTATALNLYPVETINGVSTGVAGNSGESSGSSLRGYLNLTLTASAYQTWSASLTGGFLLTYLGVSDANTAIGAATNPAVELSYNGVLFSALAVEQGQYTFWGYEHVMYGALAGIKSTFATNLVNGIKGETSAQLTPNIALTDMTVNRASDGAVVSPISF